MAQLRRSAAGAAATSRGWRGCDSDFGESAAAIRPRDRGGGRRLHSRPCVGEWLKGWGWGWGWWWER